MLIGGAVFPLLGALTYWYPKITGRMMSEGLGKITFLLVFVGFHTTFFPMHITGMAGMPRRVYTYAPGLGWDTLNLISTVGAFTIALAVLLFLVNAARSLKRGRRAGDNPWDAASLEWATGSPPPPYNFPHVPVVSSRTPLWTERERLPVLTGLRVDDRETLLTTVVEAMPDVREPSPEPSVWPLLSALAVTILFVASIFTPWAIVWGSIPVTIALILWFWPRKLEPRPEPVIE